MEKIFRLKENGTDVRTEIFAGLTTFMTMAYIIALNPNILTAFGSEGGSELWNGVSCNLYCLGNRHFRYGFCCKQAFCYGSRNGA